MPSLKELSAKRVNLSSEYATHMKRLGEIRQHKALKIIEIRVTTKSDKAAEMVWDTTEEGQEEIMLAHLCKGLEKLISSLNTELRMQMAMSYDNFTDSQ